MKNLEMVLYPDDRLRTEVKKIEDVKDPKWSEIAEKMAQMMKKQNGIGIAGPQVGIMYRITIIHTEEGPLPLLNPEIISHSKDTTIGDEGCLSIPGTFGTVERYKKIEVKAFSFSGEEFTFEAKGLFARVIQHEIDHLNGVLFIDKVIEYTKNPIDTDSK